MLMLTAPSLLAQEVPEMRDFIMHSAPAPVFTAPDPVKYNIKLGNLTARFHASIQAELNDNINLAAKSPEADFSIGPDVQVGFQYTLNKKNVLQFNLGLGYRYFFLHPEISTFSLAPNSRVEYRLALEKIQITLHDNFSIQVDPSSRPDISAASSAGNSVLNFRRINNSAGVGAEWRPLEDVGLSASYDYVMDRSLTASFRGLDRNDHTFSLAGAYTVSEWLIAGLRGIYTRSFYIEHVQNDATSYSIGPSITARAGKFLTADLSVGYAATTFDHTGTVADFSEFRGLNVTASLRHVMNSRMSEELRFNKGRDLGLGSNFNEIMSVQYGLHDRVTSAMTINSTIAYENFSSSGLAGEKADRFLIYLGTSSRLTRDWTLGLAYAFSTKTANFVSRDYTQNRFTLDLTRQF